MQLRHIFAAKRDGCLGHFALLRAPGGNLRMAMLLSRIAESMPLPAELGRVDGPVVVALQNISQIRATCEKIGNGMKVVVTGRQTWSTIQGHLCTFIVPIVS